MLVCFCVMLVYYTSYISMYTILTSLCYCVLLCVIVLITLVYFSVMLVYSPCYISVYINIVTTSHTASLPLHQISGRGSICDPLGDNNVWTVPQGIASDLSDKRITLVATKVSGHVIPYMRCLWCKEYILNVYDILVILPLM